MILEDLGLIIFFFSFFFCVLPAHFFYILTPFEFNDLGGRI